jgi:glyoxylase-like metal-dependent hydrolase (beta-lactamase superfamily II)
MSNRLPLEDNFDDVLAKAQRGHGLADSVLCEKSGVGLADLKSLKSGSWDEAIAQRIAPVLGLNPDALAGLAKKNYHPAGVQVDGLAQFNTPFDDFTVNAYLVWEPTTLRAAAFDTGSDCSEMLATISSKNLKLEAIFLTHTDGDHIFDLDRLVEKTGVKAFTSSREPLPGAESFDAGRTFTVGGLSVETRLTFGHSEGGITYVISGLERPVGIVGDAVFAGSMGGGRVSFAEALRTNREEIMTLPDGCVLCPGHGPMTSVGEERLHNPFLSA